MLRFDLELLGFPQARTVCGGDSGKGFFGTVSQSVASVGFGAVTSVSNREADIVAPKHE
jgi:hypothetical protein